MKNVEYKITGYVQGVGLRYFIWSAANDLGIKGTVKNCSDGSVHICAAGTDAQLKRFKEIISEGNGFSKIHELEENPGKADAGFESFLILR